MLPRCIRYFLWIIMHATVDDIMMREKALPQETGDLFFSSFPPLSFFTWPFHRRISWEREKPRHGNQSNSSPPCYATSFLAFAIPTSHYNSITGDSHLLFLHSFYFFSFFPFSSSSLASFWLGFSNLLLYLIIVVWELLTHLFSLSCVALQYGRLFSTGRECYPKRELFICCSRIYTQFLGVWM